MDNQLFIDLATTLTTDIFGFVQVDVVIIRKVLSTFNPITGSGTSDSTNTYNIKATFLNIDSKDIDDFAGLITTSDKKLIITGDVYSGIDGILATDLINVSGKQYVVLKEPKAIPNPVTPAVAIVYLRSKVS
jgi:hypothetical protein